MSILELQGSPLAGFSERREPTADCQVSHPGTSLSFLGQVVVPLRSRREQQRLRCRLQMHIGAGQVYRVPPAGRVMWECQRQITCTQLESLAGQVGMSKTLGGLSLASGSRTVARPAGRRSSARDGTNLFVPGGGLSVAQSTSICSAVATLDIVALRRSDESEEALGGAEKEARPAREEGQNGADVLSKKEVDRRKRISVANSGRVPWNKGRKWSPEVKAKIQARTKAIMNEPVMKEKMRQLNYHVRRNKPASEEARENIRRGMRAAIEARRATTEAQKANLQEWKDAISEAARLGLPGDKELEWRGPRSIGEVGEPARKKKSRKKKVETGQVDPSEALDQSEAIAQVAPKGRASRGSRSEEHRKKIAEAVRVKWMDPQYRAKVSAGMSRSMTENPRVKKSAELEDPKTPAEKKPRASRAKKAASVLKQAPDVSTNESAPNVAADPAFLAAVMGSTPGSGEGQGAVGQSRIRKVRIIDRRSEKAKVASAAAEGAVPRDVDETEAQELGREGRLNEAEASGPDQAGIEGGEELAAGVPIDGLLEGILRIHEERREVEEKKKELTGRARMLMDEAERATKALEAAADLDEDSRASLEEARQLLDEAARSIQAAEMDNLSAPRGSLSLEQVLHGPFIGPDGREEPSHRALFRAARMGEGTPQEQADRLRLLAECFGLTLYEFSQAGSMGNFEVAHQALVKEARHLRLGKADQGGELFSTHEVAENLSCSRPLGQTRQHLRDSDLQ